MMDFVVENLPRFLGGAWLTIQLAAISCGLGFLLAVPIALARLSRNEVLRGVATSYIFFFRGTPLLAQLFLIYYGSGQFRPALDAVGLWTFFRDPWFCAILSLTLNSAAYASEILRGAIQAIPKGEIEAAEALGLTRLLRLRLIVLPRALRIGWPAYSNEVVYQIQATSLVSIITVLEITGVARTVGSRDFTFFEAFGLAAVLYLILVYGFLYVSRRIEMRLNRHLGTSGPGLATGGLR
ncbi:ABC transporter permease [Sagittula stellata]|uniref:Probable amino acid ABC transporter, permease protein n=1 Tax=Sagittula stellata (strain ATCC 700073 / DSM 11524 / E-37) TaxID=388399 RepID=A3K7R1_SAGS3|nr:ABC transporter permease subunit [Sagittula stellata]EBA06683.1 probable amino acid ABC transporter, permease protein [Sagittula stellata E-37]